MILSTICKVLCIFSYVYNLAVVYGKLLNKNDNIHKNEVQQIRWSDQYWQYTLAEKITEYHIISNL